MEERFYDKSNYELLYNVLNEDIKTRFNLIMNEIPVNTGQLIYESMEEAYLNKNTNDTITTINQSVLKKCIPKLISFITKTVDTNKLDFFKNTSEIEDLEGTKLLKIEESVGNNVINNNDRQRGTIDYELDMNSYDRETWSVGSSDSPYSFTVNFGTSVTFTGIGVPTDLKNVKSVEVSHVILPDNGNMSLEKYPFLYLQIEELQGIQNSTNEKGRRSIAKLIRDKRWSESDESNINYNLYNTKGSVEGSINFYGWTTDKPLVNLNRMTINILTPNGFKLESNNDTFSINNISEETDKIKITLDTNFTVNDLNIGNRIGFKLSCNNNLFEDYVINKDHTITEVDPSNNSIYINRNVLSYEYNSSGDIEYTYEDYGDINFESGFIMNLSVQSSIGLKLTSEIYKFPEETMLT